MLEGKTVVVCGVGPGLGGEVARLALRDGAQVMIAARREDKLKSIAAELDPGGERVAWKGTNIADLDQCTALADAAAERFGGIDALVLVAAYDSVFGSFEEVKAEDWRETYEINVIGTTQMARAVVPQLRKRGGGSIVLIGSQASMKRLTPQIAYGASKGALNSAMYHMAAELGADRIRVNTVVPTWMWGPPVKGYVKMLAKQRGVDEAVIKTEIVSNMAIPEIPADEDVAEAVIFFCSDRSRMVTGQSLLVNCGEVMP